MTKGSSFAAHPISDSVDNTELVEEFLIDKKSLEQTPQILQLLLASLTEVTERHISVIEAQKSRIGEQAVHNFIQVTLAQADRWRRDLPNMAKDAGLQLIKDFREEDMTHLERLIPESEGGTLESEIHLLHPEYKKLYDNLNVKGEKDEN